MYSQSEKILRGKFGIIHFVGIGGIGMSGLAEILHSLEYQIEGSDISDNYNVKRLRDLGIKVYIGHEAEYVKNVELIVVSSAIKPNNPILLYALEHKIPVIKRADMLAALMQLKTSIAVSGAHGKTTTTSLVACLLEQAGLAPTVINGGIINARGTNAYVGNSEFLVAEADESDGSFLKLNPAIAIVTNIDPEHMDYYSNFEKMKQAFREFISRIPFYGFAVLCMDNKTTKELKDEIHNQRIFTYGLDNEADIMAENIRSNLNGSYFDLVINPDKKIVKDCFLPIYGRHNILNSLSVLCIGWRLGFSEDVLRNAFMEFKGVKRRFTKVGHFKDALVIDDYAHHPEEISVTIKTARDIIKSDNRVITIFQPHRYTRVASLFGDFIKVLQNGDIVLVMDVYSAGEEPISGINKHTIKEAIKQSNEQKDVYDVDDYDDLKIKLSSIAKPNDILLFMGAGDVTKYAYNIASEESN